MIFAELDINRLCGVRSLKRSEAGKEGVYLKGNSRHIDIKLEKRRDIELRFWRNSRRDLQETNLNYWVEVRLESFPELLR